MKEVEVINQIEITISPFEVADMSYTLPIAFSSYKLSVLDTEHIFNFHFVRQRRSKRTRLPSVTDESSVMTDDTFSC